MRVLGFVIALAMVAGGAFGDLLVNGGFESGTTGWSSTHTVETNSTIWGPGPAPEGSNYGSIQSGGNNQMNLRLNYQTVTLPASTPAVQFSGFWGGGSLAWTADVGVWLYDGAGIAGPVLWSDSQTFLDGGTGWIAFDETVDAPLGGFAGEQVTVAFGWQNGSGGWSNGTAGHGDGFSVVAIPEPGTILLGLAGLALLRRRR